MGYNTTVVIHNDALHSIENDKKFGYNLARAISKASPNCRMIDVPSSCHVNAAEVIETHHADHQTLVLVGGNMGQILDPWVGDWKLDVKSKEDRLTIIRKLAEKEGYYLRKKPKKT